MSAPAPTMPDRGLKAALTRSALRVQPDRRLVALARSGSNAAFEAIVDRYGAQLLRYCGRLVGPTEAEDVVQQTFLNAFRALHRDRRDIDLRPWLYRIAHNTGLNLIAGTPVAWAQLDDQMDGVAQPPDIAERHERLDALVAGIQELPHRQRRAMVLRELEGRSHEEIAREIDATTPVVRQLIYRARTRLRDGCGLILPLPLLRSILSLQAAGGAGAERAPELIAGAGAGGALVKLGAAMLATGAIATGVGGTGTIPDRHAPAPGRAEAATRPTPTIVATPVEAGTGQRRQTDVPRASRGGSERRHSEPDDESHGDGRHGQRIGPAEDDEHDQENADEHDQDDDPAEEIDEPGGDEHEPAEAIEAAEEDNVPETQAPEDEGQGA